jgi:hypothetical protein
VRKIPLALATIAAALVAAAPASAHNYKPQPPPCDNGKPPVVELPPEGTPPAPPAPPAPPPVAPPPAPPVVIIKKEIIKVEDVGCTSRRVAEFTVRKTWTSRSGREYKVIGIAEVKVRGSEKYGSFRRVKIKGHTRFRVRADYRGVHAVPGQLRTVTVRLKLKGLAKARRTVYKLRLCLPPDGNPNDSNAQDRARL